eukprot:866368_1
MSNQHRRRNEGSFFKIFCEPCNEIGSHTCGTSIIFLGFVGFYILSFLWDIFVIRGGYLSLSIAQMPSCVNRAGFENISPTLVLILLFIACFHAIALVWIIGFVHSTQLTNSCLGAELIDVPTEWPKICGRQCEWGIVIPFTCFDVFMIIEFGLSLYVYLFLQQLIEDEPEQFVDKFCINFEEVEEAFEWMQISLIFFIGTIFMGCVYCCLIRIATNDISITQHG